MFALLGLVSVWNPVNLPLFLPLCVLPAGYDLILKPKKSNPGFLSPMGLSV